MAGKEIEHQPPRDVHFVLHPHRSLTPNGFMILMLAIGSVSFVMGVAFLMMGAWPVFGFFGLDVALIYLAFKLNFRSGRIYETIDLSPDQFKLMRHHPGGQVQAFECNPYWARVDLSEDRPDGRTSLRIAAQGRQFRFGEFLTDDERREVAHALIGALRTARHPDLRPC
jgi:uncharacterized membrane protein